MPCVDAYKTIFPTENFVVRYKFTIFVSLIITHVWLVRSCPGQLSVIG